MLLRKDFVEVFSKFEHSCTIILEKLKKINKLNAKVYCYIGPLLLNAYVCYLHNTHTAYNAKQT